MKPKTYKLVFSLLCLMGGLSFTLASVQAEAQTVSSGDIDTPCNLTKAPLIPATMEADGKKECYTCSDCTKVFWDEAGTKPATEEELKIPKVASAACSQSDYDYTIAYSKSGPTVVVKDAAGKQLTEKQDYKVVWASDDPYGLRKATVTGIGNYDFKKEISCTVHPSSTLRWPKKESEFNHGSYTVDLQKKKGVLQGDDRLLVVMAFYSLLEIDKKVSLVSYSDASLFLDVDKDGLGDLMLLTDRTVLCEDGADVTIIVLPTCRIRENLEFELSEKAQKALQGIGEEEFYTSPYYEKITLQFVDPCAKGHSYQNEWNMDATGHWQMCTVCDGKSSVQPHIPGAPATGTTPQICTVCGYEIAPATGIPDPVIPSVGEIHWDDKNKGVYKVTTAEGNGGTVEYKEPANKGDKTVTVPPTITIDGITYRVTSIAKGAFRNNKKMTKIVIGSNITTIGADAFYGCAKLKTVTMGKNVTTIGDRAFYKCSALNKISIPSKVAKIGKSAFYGCKKLKNITIKTTKLTAKKVGNNAFKSIHKQAVIKVPTTKLKAYTTLLKKKGIGKDVSIKK